MKKLESLQKLRKILIVKVSETGLFFINFPIHCELTYIPILKGGATQSEDVQQNQIEATSEENEGADGVSSEGEKQAVEEVEVSQSFSIDNL